MADDEFLDHGERTIRAKWVMGGATTLAEAARLLREFADSIDQLAADGWALAEPIDDDYGFMHKPQFLN